jgi:hypothetical protein
MDVPRSNRYYLAVALGLVAFVAVAYGGAYWFIHRAPNGTSSVPSTLSDAVRTPGAQVIPADVTVVPIPTIDPQPFPTPIINGPTPSSGSAMAWPVTKAIDPQGQRTYWTAPPDVVSQARNDYQEIDAYHRDHIFDSTPADLRRFYAEPLLDTVMKSLQEDEQKGEARGEAKLLRPDLQILGFSSDGSEVQIAEEMHGETIPVYSVTTRQLMRVEHLPVGVAVSTLIYDATDQRWKVSDSRFIPGPPGME